MSSTPEGVIDPEKTSIETLQRLFEEEDYEPSVPEIDDERMIDTPDVEKSPQVMEVPAAPSAEEREEHKLHHANFEPWCEVCVQGQGREKQHRRKKESKEHIVYSDYLFFNKEGGIVDKETGLKQKGLVTVLTGICKDSQFPFAIVVPAKGGNEYAIKALVTWIEELGWEKVTIQVDQEHSLSRLYDEVKRRLPGRVDVRKSPRYSSQSLADGEMVNGLIGGKIRTWLAEINENYGLKVNCDHYIFPWVARHSAWTLARYHINNSRTTPYRVIKGADYIGEILPFGETVMAKFPKTSEKAAPRWVNFIYAGKTSNSDEHLVLTESGAQKYRTVRRLPKGSQYQKATFEQIRGAPWNSVLGITKSKPDAVTSGKEVVQVPTVESEELYDFNQAEAQQVAQPASVPVPAPREPRAAAPASRAPRAEEPPQEEAKRGEKMQADRDGEPVEIEEKNPKRAKIEEPMPSEPEVFNIGTPEAEMSRASSKDTGMGEENVADSRDFIAAVANGEQWDIGAKQIDPAEASRYAKWLKEDQECFESETISNIMDYLDTMTRDESAIRQSRKDELKKFNDVYGAFKPRDRRELSRELTVFGHKWVDKISEGIAKSRLTCQDFKRKNDNEDKNSSETPSNFCPTPHGCSKKILEVYSLLFGLPRVKADLSSAFLIAKDQGDKKGQPVMMKPPAEWLEECDIWLCSQTKEVQDELKDVPKEEIIWQVDGNLYGRQSAAAQYRDRLEEIITLELPREKYEFARGKLDACVYRCKKTGTILVHHIDDFDICGPEHVLTDLLTVEFPKNGCKLKMGEMEYPGISSQSTSEFLGRTKINVEHAVITKPNAKHIRFLRC